MELKMMFYLSMVAIAVNISQPSVRIGGCLHALIHIFFLHGGSKSPKPLWDLKWGCTGLIGCPLVSVTIDILMKCCPNFRANGVD